MEKTKTKAKPNWLDPATTAQNEVLPGYVKWAWSSRAMSLILNVTFVAQVTYFCTDVLKMPAGIVGALLLISKVFDGFTDLVAGYLIDRTKTRFGKARPYEIFIVFVWLFTVFLFSTPDMGLTGQVIFVFIMYTIINSVCATFLDGADAVYLKRSIRNEQNRVAVVSFSSGLSLLFMIILFIALPSLIKMIGDSKEAWTIMTLCFAIPLGLIGILRFIFVKEVVQEEEKVLQQRAKTSLLELVKVLLRNKYLWMIALASFCVNLQLNTYGTVSNYYFKYIMGDIGVGSLAGITNLATPIFLIFYPSLAKKIGHGNLLRASGICCALGAIIRLIGGTNIITIIIGTILATVSAIPGGFMAAIYLIDCMAYGEWKNGIRLEGMTTSVTSFLSKVAKGLSSGLVGLIMGMAHYDGSLSVQPESANLAIIGLYNLAPLILGILIFVFTYFYRLDKEMPKINEELEARNSEGQ